MALSSSLKQKWTSIASSLITIILIDYCMEKIKIKNLCFCSHLSIVVTLASVFLLPSLPDAVLIKAFNVRESK